MLIVVLLLGLLTILISGIASATDVPFSIEQPDALVPDAGTDIVPLPDPEGNTQELGPKNANYNKLGDIDDNDPTVTDDETLGYTNPNPQVDLADVWIGTREDSHGNIWFYFGWLRDANKGSGVIAVELGANAPPENCDYSLIGTANEQDLIDNCNPWLNRADGDTLFSWDQQGNDLIIEERTFDDANNTWGPGTAIPATDAVASFSEDGFYGEVAINLTATIFTPGECLSVGNIIPGTITGNSDNADYKDTVLGDTGINISNCGAIKVVKEDDGGNRLNGVTFDIYQDDGDDVYEPGADDAFVDSCTTATVSTNGSSEDGVCVVEDLLAEFDYWVAEDTGTVPAGYNPANPAQQLVSVTVNGVTVVTFVNPRQRGSIIIEKVVKGTSTRIDGASFALDDDGDPATTDDQTAITGVAGETGLFCVDDLLFGTYYVVETVVPVGYEAETLVQSHSVNSESDCSDAATRSADLTFENEAQPALTTLATAAATVGDTIFDTATLSGGFNPTGTITFNLYDNGTCSGDAIFTDTETVNGNGDYTTDPGYVTAAAGTYYWLVSYSGDGSNASATHLCGAAGEVTTVAKESPTLTTLATAAATVGDTIFDTATLDGGFNPTGTITFELYDNGECSGDVIFTDTETVNGNGDYTTDPGYVTAAAGTYYWLVSYSGDANNDPASHACGAEGEVSEVDKAQPSLATAPKLLPNDDATLSGIFTDGSGPFGTISFELYGSADCGESLNDTPLYSEGPIDVTGDGTYSTNNTNVYIVADGTYSWLVSYSGDGNNNAAFSACDAEQQVIDFTPLGE